MRCTWFFSWQSSPPVQRMWPPAPLAGRFCARTKIYYMPEKTRIVQLYCYHPSVLLYLHLAMIITHRDYQTITNLKRQLAVYLLAENTSSNLLVACWRTVSKFFFITKDCFKWRYLIYVTNWPELEDFPELCNLLHRNMTNLNIENTISELKVDCNV